MSNNRLYSMLCLATTEEKRIRLKTKKTDQEALRINKVNILKEKKNYKQCFVFVRHGIEWLL
ncbi:uncharacterized protein B0P05DRAFT_559492 [Gilbertella persicaria]|uniref:uncharacterized protein n=1 Tax=Gilbertella persicaria TaxID=101096 RepID=UPI00221EDEC2|nr:uncharacterized protein B0P05DRAFT_559492 [Gilbertella persicaria]KAI8058700.1 hypothetical protein B0P05DRAFT_559492 [Gilbertella persicaria]